MPEPCVQMDSASIQQLVLRQNLSSQVAADGYQFVSESMRLNHQLATGLANANAARVVLEAGSGRVRNLDATIAGEKSSG